MRRSCKFTSESVRFIFWNIHNNPDNLSRIVNYAIERDIHVIALCEAGCIPKNLFTNDIYRRIEYIYPDNDCDIELLVKKDFIKTINYYTENPRYNTIYINELDLILAIAHLNSEQSSGAKFYRQVDISNMLEIINRLEERVKNKKTIVLGDLNFGLFDDQMLSFPGLNARLFLSEMKKTSSMHKVVKDCLYNPMLNVYHDNGDADTAKGTYYYKNALEKWCCYDHLLMKQPLVNRFIKNKLEIVSRIGSEPLIRNNKPIQSISDHLPIYFELTR